MAKKKSKKEVEDVVVQAVDTAAERAACATTPVDPKKFNQKAKIPYGLTIEHIEKAMTEFLAFLSFINEQLHGREIQRFETMLMPANFSSMVGEFIASTIPKHCKTLVKNNYHNGHPDMLPAGLCKGDSCQHGTEGIEIKGSRYSKAWQGHNAEECWLMVFVFDANRGKDQAKGLPPKPFRFSGVYLGRLTKADWKFAGRKEGSRRTITASVTPEGFAKMKKNWVYFDDGTPAGDDLFELLGSKE